MVRVTLIDMNPDVKDNRVLELGPFKRVRVIHDHLWAEGQDKELIAYFDAEMDRWVRTETIPGTDAPMKVTYTDFIIEPVNADEDENA